MAWTPKNKTTVPKVIAGPILRKVTPSSVSVFIATKDSAAVTLKVYEAGTSTVLKSGTATPIKIGNNLYVAVITASTGGTSLSPDTTYGYNLYWGTEHLGSDNVLVVGPGSTSSIAYNFASNAFPLGPGAATFRLPTFVLPPSDISDLWLLQGSCRKPHGENYDAMEGIHTVINNAVISSTPAKRPHMLFLTGDQIYADDVADSLLQMIIDTAGLSSDLNALMGWDEGTTVPTTAPHGVGGVGTADYDLNALFNAYVTEKYEKVYSGGAVNLQNGLKPGLRSVYAQYAVKYSGDDDSTCKSHLLEFREFAMMYLFAWSDVLWPLSGTTLELPEWSDVKKLAPSSGTTTISITELLPPSKVKKINTSDGLGSKYETITVSTAYIKDYEKFTIENFQLENFYSTLKNVRKALANVPVYMTLDDHEVTDDLFYNHEWNENVLGGIPGGPITAENPYGRRMVANGLAAFAVFQAWGNTPEQFSGSAPGVALLSAIESVAASPSSSNPDWETIQDIVLPEFDDISLTYISPPSTYKACIKSATGIDWNYRYTHSSINFEVISLDTRTVRAFRNLNDYAGLLSDAAIDSQVGTISSTDVKQLTILITPTPILDYGIDKFSIYLGYKSQLSSDIPLPENINNPNHPIGINWDFEVWNKDKIFMYTFIFKLLNRIPAGATGARIVSLTGDVHYAVNKRLEMVISTPYRQTLTGSKLVIASLCASSFKNETKATRLGEIIDDYFVYNNDITYGFGYNNYLLNTIPDPHNASITKSMSPAIFTRPFLASSYSSFGHDWLYKTKLIANSPYAYTPAATGNKDEILVEHSLHCFKKRRDADFTTGINNFGEITFDWSTKIVKHVLWARDTENAGSSSSTFPVAPFKPFEISLDFHSPPSDDF